ncbi:transmembrane protein, putative (macronuclear) [Tetrahymena thermophila SB210]|uniref:Transmembrane protein, putative n=1 Tax=Tetrahymena thermophila (strain SB210) TaxID=312017 RepID=W7XGR4_TETTS|nr:transmembrane protein, putative [Tetrahymena thermophila SB210]EWS73396.1 transmembrane protein, putative [Tetrahymena thermophila SB210]|eukprot:XP_012654069.1 transmembrane protein, putative [Tetrahymena thermophila SB210]
MFIIQLLFNMIQVNIPSEKQNRNIFQNCLFYLKQKYPEIFENIQIVREQRFQSIIKLKKVRIKIQKLAIYLKNNQFYQQQSFQTVINKQKSQITSQGSPLFQFSKFKSFDSNESSFFKKKQQNINSNISKKQKYFPRISKLNEPSFKNDSFIDKF